jgi:hypothetical protein
VVHSTSAVAPRTYFEVCVTNIGRTDPRSPMMRRHMPTTKTTVPWQKYYFVTQSACKDRY